MTDQMADTDMLTQIDRVRRHTSAEANQAIDRATDERVRAVAAQGAAALADRIAALEREWDTERVLEANASTLAVVGVLLGATVHERWLWVPGVVLPFLFQHAVQGWCPPLLLIRARGIRTRREIDVEKYPLKALRGDFGPLASGAPAEERAQAALQAARRSVA